MSADPEPTLVLWNRQDEEGPAEFAGTPGDLAAYRNARARLHEVGERISQLWPLYSALRSDLQRAWGTMDEMTRSMLRTEPVASAQNLFHDTNERLSMRMRYYEETRAAYTAQHVNMTNLYIEQARIQANLEDMEHRARMQYLMLSPLTPATPVGENMLSFRPAASEGE